LEAVEDTVVKQAMFSENEELDEINEENLKWVFYPYCVHCWDSEIHFALSGAV
jgi:hypothetical protein